MQEFKAHIVMVNRKGRLLFFSVAAALASAATVLMILGLIPVIFQLFSIGIFVFTSARYYLQTRKYMLKEPVSELIISEESIIAFGNTYLIHELNAVMISISGWKSYKKSGDRSVPITDMHAGDKNFIGFIYKGEERKIEFLMESEAHWQQLREHVFDWYRRNIKVIESVNGMKSYGLQVLNYAGVQEFKKIISTSQTK